MDDERAYDIEAAPAADEDDVALAARDEHEVDRLLARRRRLEAKRTKRVNFLAEERRLMDDYEADQIGPLDRDIARIDRSLENWARQINEADPETTSWVFPHGSFTLRRRKQRVFIANEKLFLEWAKQNRRFDLLKAEPSRSAIGESNMLIGKQLDDGTQTVRLDEEDVVVTVNVIIDTETGERVPGIALVRPVLRGFSARTVSPERDNADADTNQEENHERHRSD